VVGFAQHGRLVAITCCGANSTRRPVRASSPAAAGTSQRTAAVPDS
jgi:hypothetical protein